MQHFHVRVARDDQTFSAAHFITLAGGTCERLHGHNYRVAVEVQGPLDENHYVIDFAGLRETLRGVLDELDHHVLLPTDHPAIRVEAGEREVEVRFAQRRWLFPRDDCRLLPMANTTTELLARYVGCRLMERLELHSGSRPAVLRIEVQESAGLWAACELRHE